MVAEVSRSKAIAVALRRATVKDTTGADVDLTPVVGRESDEAGVDVADAADAESSEA